MSYSIITNNPLIAGNFENTVFVDTDFEGILIRIRDLVHTGHELISHPLGASIRMLYSPYRSILIGDITDKRNADYLDAIENSIVNYKNTMGKRRPDTVNSQDYAKIDKELLASAIKEYKMISNT